jgi:hypothetical protein
MDFRESAGGMMVTTGNPYAGNVSREALAEVCARAEMHVPYLHVCMCEVPGHAAMGIALCFFIPL